MTIIAICGFQGSGKDTLADILIKKYSFTKLSFAGVLKDIVSILFGWDRKMLEGVTKEDREKREVIDEWWASQLGIPNLTPRWVLMHFGTELFRNHFHQNFWVIVLKRRLNSSDRIVITDCRFPNEIQMIREMDGIIVHIDRMKPQWFDRYRAGEDVEETNRLHDSEKMWIREKFDYVLQNDGTIEDLKKSTKNLLVSMNIRKQKSLLHIFW